MNLGPVRNPFCRLVWKKIPLSVVLLLALHGVWAASALAAQSSKRGVGTWYTSGTETAMNDISSSCSWFYTWETNENWVHHPSNMEFVPMIWDETKVHPDSLQVAKNSSEGTLLGFNEPDRGDQANMTVTDALNLWPQLEALNLRLGSPAVAGNAEVSGEWLDDFMQGVSDRGYRVDFICVHKYISTFDTESAVTELRNFLQAVYDKYQKPIWLTEYALINWFSTPMYPTTEQQAAFAAASAEMLESLSFVERYAWFSMPPWDGNIHLYESNGTITSVGTAYRDAATGTVENQAPTANAGSDKTITLPSNASLSGSASDDGLPSDNLTTTWSKQSGPGTVSFGSTGQLSTTASFSTSGTYVLRLTADDGELSAYDELTVTVNPEPVENQAPTANAGSDKTITLPSNASLSGSASDDGLPSDNLTTTWSKQSGPGTVSFGNTGLQSTTASFGTSGTYVLRLTANDGELSAYDELTVTVNPEPPRNEAPVVDVGEDRSIELGQTLTLVAVVSDDGLPSGTLTSRWRVTENAKKNLVTFGDDTADSTTVDFDRIGTYTLRLTVDDGALSSFDEIVITVTEPPTHVRAGDMARRLHAEATARVYTIDGRLVPARRNLDHALLPALRIVRFRESGAVEVRVEPR